MPQLCAMILQEAPPPPRHFRPELPEGLQHVMLRCLEKDKNRRFANVGELATALVPYGSRGAGRSAERVSRVLSVAGISSSQLNLPTSVPPDAVEAATQANFGKTGATSSHRALFIGLASFGVLAALAGALAWRHVVTPAVAEPTALDAAAPASPAAPPVEVKAEPAHPVPAQPAAVPDPAAAPSATPPEPAATAAPAVPTPAAPARPSVAAGRPRPAARPANPLPAPAPKPAPAAKPATPTIDPLAGRR